jgi:hypothetical protein
MSSFKYQVSGCRKQRPYVVLPYTCRNLSHSICDKIKDRKKNILQIIGNQNLTEINNEITCNIQRLDAISLIPPTDNVNQSIRPVENLNPNFWIIKKIRYALSLIKNTIVRGKLIMTWVIALGLVCCLPL